MESKTESNSGSVATAAAAAVAPDPVTAELLVKHEAGARLSPQEYGKLGAWKASLRKLNPFTGGKPGVAPGSPQPGPGAGNAPGVASLASDQTPAPGLDPVPVDTALAQRTAAAILNRLDPIATRIMERHAKAAGASGETYARLVTAAAIPANDKKLIVDLAPDICAELGVDVRKFPIWTALGVLGLHATNLWLAIDDLKELAEEKRKHERPAEKPANVTAVTEPARP